MQTETTTDSRAPRQMTRRSYRLPIDTLERLRAASSATGIHLAYLLEDAIEAHVRSLGGPFDVSPDGRPFGPPPKAKRRRAEAA